MEDVLRREGITAATSDAQQREEEWAAPAINSDAAEGTDAGVDVARTPVRVTRSGTSLQEEKKQRSDATSRADVDEWKS